MESKSMNRINEHLADEGEQPAMGRYLEATESAIKEYPLGVTLAVFAAGLGVGALIGNALAEPMGMRRQPTAENLGRKILDSISEYLPASVQKQLYG